jgi:hypothetical protein
MMRLVRELGLAGVRRAREVRTTMPGKEGLRAGGLLRREFTAPALGLRHHARGDLVRDRVCIVLDFLLAGDRLGRAFVTYQRTRLILDSLQMALCGGPGACGQDGT